MYRGNAKNLTRAGRGTDSSGSRGGAGSPIEGKQKAFVPPPAGRAGRVPREVFRGKCRIPPAGFASRGRVASPRRGTRRPPLGASGALPPRFARLRGRGLPRFCRLHHVGPLRPGTKNLPPPDPRVGNTNISNEIIPRAPDIMIHPPPGSRGCYALNPACLAPRTTLAETPVPGPRGRRRVIFCVTFSARIFRFPMELRSPAPRALKQ